MKRGPENKWMPEFWPAKAIVKDGGKRWAFKCRHCSTCVPFQFQSLMFFLLTFFYSVLTFARSTDATNWKDEPCKPQVGNLNTHIKQDHKDVRERVLSGKAPETAGETSTSRPFDDGFSAGSKKILEDFVRDGLLNPAREATQDGFYKLFAGWVLDADLAFTTGENLTLRSLFEYIKCRFPLPSDTTVRNYVTRIFVELHGQVVRELTVCEFRRSFCPCSDVISGNAGAHVKDCL